MYDQQHQQWVLTQGDLAYWIDDDQRPVRCKIELVTDERVYLIATADDYGKRKGQRWYEARFSRRVSHRDATYIRNNRATVNWHTVRIDSPSMLAA